MVSSHNYFTGGLSHKYFTGALMVRSDEYLTCALTVRSGSAAVTRGARTRTSARASTAAALATVSVVVTSGAEGARAVVRARRPRAGAMVCCFVYDKFNEFRILIRLTPGKTYCVSVMY